MTPRHFNQATIEETSTYSISLAGDAHPLADEQGFVRGIKVFRSGTFPDSRGRIKTYTVADLQAMAANYAMLCSDGTFPNVPVREDHTESVKDIIGYYSAVYVGDIDATGNAFLLADVQFTEPHARQKWNNKTYRSRSIELGAYPTNAGKVVKPTIIGLAMVDIPAVEGLFRHPIAQPGNGPGDQSPAPTPQSKGDPVTTETSFKFRLKGGEESDPAAVQAHITALEAAADAAASAGAFKFRIAGTKEESDFSKVQEYITSLESSVDTLSTFKKETLETSRKDFVSGLAKGNVITNTQIEPMTEMVLSMTPEQFAKFQTTYAAAPANNLFAKHDTTGAGGAGDGDAAKVKAQEIEDLRAIVANHKYQVQSGKMTREHLEASNSYKKLMILTEGKG